MMMLLNGIDLWQYPDVPRGTRLCSVSRFDDISYLVGYAEEKRVSCYKVPKMSLKDGWWQGIIRSNRRPMFHVERTETLI